MQQRYANLRHYNEDYGANQITTTMNDPGVLLIECPMEGYFYDPVVITLMSGQVTIIVVEDSFIFSVRVRHGSNITGVYLQLVDETGEPGKVLTHLYVAPIREHDAEPKSGLLSKGTISFASSDWTRASFLDMIRNETLIASITTTDHPEGEIAGFLAIVFP